MKEIAGILSASQESAPFTIDMDEEHITTPTGGVHYDSLFIATEHHYAYSLNGTVVIDGRPFESHVEAYRLLYEIYLSDTIQYISMRLLNNFKDLMNGQIEQFKSHNADIKRQVDMMYERATKNAQ